MTGAMYAAIAGLRTHMQNLNVIGNNIANVNTYGYKASRAVFKTSLYTTLNGGSNGTVSMGGINPSQIGYGSVVSTVDIDMSTGNYAVTGKSTDLMLDGDGFFLVGSKEIANTFNGSSDDVNRLTAFTLTRVGNFEFRADGYLAKEDGNCVYGFLCIGRVTAENQANYPGKKLGDPIFSDQLVPIRVPRLETAYYDASNTRLDPTKDADKIWNDVNDKSKGLKEEVTEGFAIAYPNYGTDADGKPLTTGHLQDANGGVDPDTKETIELAQAQFNGISFDPNSGVITGISKDTGEVVTIGCIAIGTVTNPNGVTNLGDNYYKAGDGSGKLSINILGGNASEMGISQINKSLQTVAAGETPEVVTGLTVYSSLSHIISNGLEMSKTDLAQEIANMILTQRGYQANTRIVTVTDSMLEELVNMKR